MPKDKLQDFIGSIFMCSARDEYPDEYLDDPTCDEKRRIVLRALKRHPFCQDDPETK